MSQCQHSPCMLAFSISYSIIVLQIHQTNLCKVGFLFLVALFFLFLGEVERVGCLNQSCYIQSRNVDKYLTFISFGSGKILEESPGKMFYQQINLKMKNVFVFSMNFFSADVVFGFEGWKIESLRVTLNFYNFGRSLRLIKKKIDEQIDFIERFKRFNCQSSNNFN